jgi:hypothetical protein
MEEEQIERKIAVTHLQRIFGADKAEVASQLNKTILQLAQQTKLHVDFCMDRRKT